MTENVSSLDGLVKGIKHLLSEDRCSFSDEEKVLLNDCILTLQQIEKTQELTGKPDLGEIAAVIEFLIKLMVVSEHLKNLF